jgi:hypothetical protein
VGHFADLEATRALLFAIFRLDRWVFLIAAAIPLVCLVGLGAWHLLGYLARKLSNERRPVRSSPEPLWAFPPRDKAVDSPVGGPESIQRDCAELENALADAYMELAESWLRAGRPLKAEAVWQRVVLVCPDGPQAARARELLRGSLSSGPAHS